MVVVLAAVCDDGGAILLSKQFFEMKRGRVEQLVYNFGSLVREGAQNTVLETDTVRYLYSPLEPQLYLTIATTLDSNVFEDNDTLAILGEMIHEQCEEKTAKKKSGLFVLGAVQEAQPATLAEKIRRATFEILFGMEEAVFGGIRTVTTASQLSTILEMESHDEMMQIAITREKEQDAKDIAKRRMKEIELEKRGERAAKHIEKKAPPAAAPKTEEAPKRPAARGMQLGRKVERASGKEQSAVLEAVVEETVEIELGSDGSLRVFEVDGVLRIKACDKKAAKARLYTEHNTGLEFQTHPNIDRDLFEEESCLCLKGKASQFPVQKGVSVLRWKEVLQDSEDLPLRAVCWTSSSERDGVAVHDVSVEVSQCRLDVSLSDVEVEVPSEEGEVFQCDGECVYDGERRAYVWSVGKIDGDSPSSVLEFRVCAASGEVFFPVKIVFSSDDSISHFSVIRADVPGTEEDVELKVRRKTASRKVCVVYAS
ncbi:MAG: coatomer subunit delta [Amphiamblys sp. WSBS2006]|nr:MAG: coatomer subunit delta [Amphiamblys sp. WSBS2006]